MLPLLHCDGRDPGWTLRLAEDADVPSHHFKTNSHLVPIRLTLYEREPAPAGPEVSWTLALSPRPLAEAEGATVHVTWERPSGDRDLPPMEFAPELDLGVPPRGTRRARVRVEAPPPSGLLAAYDLPRRPLGQYTELARLPENPLDPRIEQPIWAGRGPTLRALRTLGRKVVEGGARLAVAAAIVQLGLALVALRRRKSAAPVDG